jgi:multisubunit Na+/H+ antiporter MnhG subunit
MKKRSFRTERDFGLIVGGVFTLLSLWWFYRGKFQTTREITVSVGLLLLLLGLVLPKALVWPNKVWMGFAEVLSFVSTRIILGIVFFLIISPIGFIKRMFGWDPLNRRAGAAETYWKDYPERQRNPRHYEKMY